MAIWLLSQPHRTYIWEKLQRMSLRTASSIVFVYVRHRFSGDFASVKMVMLSPWSDEPWLSATLPLTWLAAPLVLSTILTFLFWLTGKEGLWPVKWKRLSWVGRVWSILVTIIKDLNQRCLRCSRRSWLIDGPVYSFLFLFGQQSLESKVVGSGRTGISGSSDIVATMGDSEFGGLTSSTRTSRRDGRTQDGSRGTFLRDGMMWKKRITYLIVLLSAQVHPTGCSNLV